MQALVRDSYNGPKSSPLVHYLSPFMSWQYRYFPFAVSCHEWNSLSVVFLLKLTWSHYSFKVCKFCNAFLPITLEAVRWFFLAGVYWGAQWACPLCWSVKYSVSLPVFALWVSSFHLWVYHLVPISLQNTREKSRSPIFYIGKKREVFVPVHFKGHMQWP